MRIDADDRPEPDVEAFLCPMCHRDAPIHESLMIGGRRFCFGCAGAWYEDDEESDEKRD